MSATPPLIQAPDQLQPTYLGGMISPLPVGPRAGLPKSLTPPASALLAILAATTLLFAAPNSNRANRGAIPAEVARHRDFDDAKRILPQIFAGLEQEIYCGCNYSGKLVDWESCGFIPRKNAKRASRIEWEHVVPAWVIGHQRQCWQDGGRKNCTANDSLFNLAEGDLNNLVPAVGEINGDRSNFAYSVWTRDPVPQYGTCRSIVDFKAKKFQPREEVRGRLARITLHIHRRYDLQMSKQDRQLMCAWARSSPVDEWEREREKRIVAAQGEGNPLVASPDLIADYCNR